MNKAVCVCVCVCVCDLASNARDDDDEVNNKGVQTRLRVRAALLGREPGQQVLECHFGGIASESRRRRLLLLLLL